MTTYIEARDAIVIHINNALKTVLPALPVYWENTDKVDVNTVGNAFLQVAVDFEHAIVATMTDDAIDHVLGYIGFRLFAKEGQGTRATLESFDLLNVAMRHQNIGPVRTGSPTPGKKISQDGWFSVELGVPFEYYT